MKKNNKVKKPFFSKFLEAQKISQTKDLKGGLVVTTKFPFDVIDDQTQKYPSDNDEGGQTQKYPSDGDEI